MADDMSAPHSAGLTEEGETAELEAQEEYLSGSGSGPAELKTMEQQSLCEKEKSYNMQGNSGSMFSIRGSNRG